MVDIKSSTMLFLLVSSALVLILFVCTAIYVPQLQIIWFYSSSHPLLALNLLILLIIVSSRCFAISRNHYSLDHDQFIYPPNSQDAEDSIAEARTSKSKKKGTLESTWKKTEDSVRPAELLTDRGNNEVTSSGSSSLSSAKLRREVSLTKDEVNRRVERFIRKFNDD